MTFIPFTRVIINNKITEESKQKKLNEIKKKKKLKKEIKTELRKNKNK